MGLPCSQDISHSGLRNVALGERKMEWHIALGEAVIRVAVQLREAAIDLVATADLSAVAGGVRRLVAGLLAL